MNKYLKSLLFLLILITIIFVGCPTNTSDDKDGGGDKSSSKSKGGTSTSVVVEDTVTETDTDTDTGTGGTGTVTGTINDDATVTIDQSDGTSQTTTTTPTDPDFIFEDVPEGEATVIVENGDGETTSQTVQVNDGETTQVNPFGSTQQMENSLTARVYEVDPILKADGSLDWNTSTDNINLSKPLGFEFYSKEINVPERSFSEGFPGITDRFEFFGIIYEGQIIAPVTGTYKFEITCDDGAVLWINGIKVVDGDKVHPTKTYQGTMDLVEGEAYSFLLKYFQGPRYHITLVLKNQIPGEEKKLFNSDDYAE